MMNIKPLWKNHLLYKRGKVELIPTAWVWRYRGSDISPMTHLNDGTPADLNILWKSICENGLRDPLIVRVGVRNKKFRLESGNHRIQLFYKNGIELVPVTIQVRDECGPHVADVTNDASHNFDAGGELLISKITSEYMKPSEVFKSLSK
ncbi:MAG: ParB N-terminal domain-containing protein [Candidatus Harrisonbacteria bacterium]|nr:ParB N-terminal domain-containing protein [Candidatus Harrisonbacteria bacterium]